jgi:hypothetical protein
MDNLTPLEREMLYALKYLVPRVHRHLVDFVYLGKIKEIIVKAEAREQPFTFSTTPESRR